MLHIRDFFPKKYIKKPLFACMCVIFAALTAVFSAGCSKQSDSGIFTYAASDAEFGMIFSSAGSESGEVECVCVKKDGTYSLRVAKPERTASLVIVCDGKSVTLTPVAGDGGASCAIRLSEQAAEPLLALFGILSHGRENSSVSVSPDGEERIVTYQNGTLTLRDDAAGNIVPTLVSCADALGEVREVRITGYTIRSGEN